MGSFHLLARRSPQGEGGTIRAFPLSAFRFSPLTFH